MEYPPAPTGHGLTPKGGEMEKLLLKVDEAADLLCISRSRIYRLINLGELDSIKVGGLRRIPTIAAYEYVERKLGDSRNDAA